MLKLSKIWDLHNGVQVKGDEACRENDYIFLLQAFFDYINTFNALKG